MVEFEPGESKLLGLIPVGWYPGAVTVDATRRCLYVANIKGIGPGKRDEKTGKLTSNSHLYHGSLSLVPIPGRRDLARQTATVLRNYREPLLRTAALPPRPDQPPRPVPERVGEPSVFRHVVYIIKENRTYDQVLGDLPQGHGDPELCVFGERITPNQHKLVREFVLLDNTPYNTTSILRTIELILGLPPMNQMDEIDKCPEDVRNRVLWHAMKGSAALYPEWAVSAVPDDD